MSSPATNSDAQFGLRFQCVSCKETVANTFPLYVGDNQFACSERCWWCACPKPLATKRKAEETHEAPASKKVKTRVAYFQFLGEENADTEAYVIAMDKLPFSLLETRNRLKQTIPGLYYTRTTGTPLTRDEYYQFLRALPDDQTEVVYLVHELKRIAMRVITEWCDGFVVGDDEELIYSGPAVDDI